MTVIKSKLFVLRPFRRGDETSLRENINDWHIYRSTGLIPHPYTMKHAKDWIKRNISLSNKKKKSEINFALVIDGEIAGGIGLRSIGLAKIETHKAEIGYWLAKKHWGKGIMTKAVKLVSDFGLRQLLFRRVYATVFVKNRASVRVLEKAGFKFEGILRKNYLKDGKLIDAAMYAKVK